MRQDSGFAIDFEPGLYAETGLCEMLDAAGIDCHVPLAGQHEDDGLAAAD